MSQRVNQNARAGLYEARQKLDAFIAAARGEASSCAVFETHPGRGVEEFTAAQRAAVARYVETWVKTPLDAALESIDGNREWQNEDYLDSIR